MNDLELFLVLSIAIMWVVATTSLVFKFIADDYVYTNTPLIGSRAANEFESDKYLDKPRTKSKFIKVVDAIYGCLESAVSKVV